MDKGLELVLANAQEVRSLPGRKSDVNDASLILHRSSSRVLRLFGGIPLEMSNFYCHPGRAGGPPVFS